MNHTLSSIVRDPEIKILALAAVEANTDSASACPESPSVKAKNDLIDAIMGRAIGWTIDRDEGLDYGSVEHDANSNLYHGVYVRATHPIFNSVERVIVCDHDPREIAAQAKKEANELKQRERNWVRIAARAARDNAKKSNPSKRKNHE